ISPTEGRILDRYEFTEPWTRQLDFHYAVGLGFGRFRTEVTADVLNLLNLVNDEWGVVKFVTNQNSTPVQYAGIDSATGAHVYREVFRGAWSAASQFTVADIRSRWTGRPPHHHRRHANAKHPPLHDPRPPPARPRARASAHTDPAAAKNNAPAGHTHGNPNAPHEVSGPFWR
ncbi:MAG TPA: hypothetical protein VEA69_21365, partial [Tepidisphaeraceae bacterium]|nr:hypothetical protein [Tepidisphaeraceae bacterium]